MSKISVVPGSMCPIHHFVSTRGVPRKICIANAIRNLSEYSTSSMQYKLVRASENSGGKFRTVSLLAYDPEQISEYISSDANKSGKKMRFLPDYYRVPWQKGVWRFVLIEGRIALRYSSALGVSLPIDISDYLLGRLDLFGKWRPDAIEICTSVPEAVAQKISKLLVGLGLDQRKIEVCKVRLTNKVPRSLMVVHDFCGTRSRTGWVTLTAAGIALVFQLTSHAIGDVTNGKNIELVQAEIGDVFYEIFPETVPMLDPIRQVRRHLSELESERQSRYVSAVELEDLFWGIQSSASEQAEVSIVSISKSKDAYYRLEYSAPSHKVAQQYLSLLERELRLELKISASKVENGVVLSSVNIGGDNG